ncbi:GNAT family N-acetyltransferase [Mangrovibacter phragmitis]|uniref:GNAT family N-acetyltransferase n=1 Tax=Mangrovibacter phragmitis TaxID=1691903 RepID=UPI00336A931D
MKIRRAQVADAGECWNIRNQAIRHGCRHSYATDVIAAWTPDTVPAGQSEVIEAFPFFVAEHESGRLVATGFLDVDAQRVEAVFTLPEYTGLGAASLILDTVKAEARQRGMAVLSLSSTPNAQSFYEKHGFESQGERTYYSSLAQQNLYCIEMILAL